MKREDVLNEYVDLIFKYRDDVPFLKNHDMDTKEKIKDYLTKDVIGITSSIIAYSLEHDLRNLLKYDDYKNFAINYGFHGLDIINGAQKKYSSTKYKTIGDLCREKLSKLKNEEICEIVGASGICKILGIKVNDIINLAPSNTQIICGDLEMFLKLPDIELKKIIKNEQQRKSLKSVNNIKSDYINKFNNSMVNNNKNCSIVHTNKFER